MTLKERVAEMVHKLAVQLSEEQKADQAEAKLASAMLDNGQEIQTSAEAFAEGVDVFVVNDQGEQIPLPDGDYTLDDGTTFTVAEGVVSAMAAAVEQKEEEELSSEEPAAEQVAEQAAEPAVEQALSREEVSQMIADAVEAATTQLSAHFSEQLQAKEEQIQQLSAQPAAKLPRAEVKKHTRQELASMTVKERVRALSQI